MPSRAPLVAAPLVLAAASAFALATSCGGGGSSSDPPDASLEAGDAAAPRDARVSESGFMPDAEAFPCDGCAPFPSSAPACQPTALGAAKIVYPPDGVLVPPNLGSLEVQFLPPDGATLFEIDFASPLTDLRIEATCTPVVDARDGTPHGCGVTLPRAAWDDLANQNFDVDPLTVTVRATKADGACVSSSRSIAMSIAHDPLSGGLYYWQSSASGATGGVYALDFDTPGPATPFYVPGQSGTCIGCHSASRDGQRLAIATRAAGGADDMRTASAELIDLASRFALGGAAASPGFATFTHDHAKMIASTFRTQQSGGFDVFDDQGTRVAQVAMGGLSVTQPDLGADDHTLVFVVPQANTISQGGDHHFMGGSIFTASFDPLANTLGAPVPVLHAPNATLGDGGVGGPSYFYPSLSSDGTFVLFDAVEASDSFYDKGARVKLVHYPTVQGSTPIDLGALNQAEGLTNSFPRWASTTHVYQGERLAWVVFSSNRDYGLHLTGNAAAPNCYPPGSPGYDAPQPLAEDGGTYAGCAVPQLWMAAVKVDPSGQLDLPDRSFPAFWVPGQDPSAHDHAAQWVSRIVAPAVGATCGKAGDPCTGPSAATCCADAVCCNGACAATCAK